jgi:hypothetical protein
MTTFRKILAGVCAFLFVVSGFAALLLINVEQKVFSPGTYKQVFEQIGLYEDSAGLFAGLMVTQSEGSDGALALFSAFDREELELVISSLLPPEELKTLTNALLDSAFAFLNGETDSITISLASIKRYMAGEGGAQAVTRLLEIQPDCTPEQLFQMGLDALSNNGGMILCKPPEEMMGLVTPLIESQLEVMSRGLPDELTVFTAAQIGAARDLRPQLKNIRTLMKWSAALPLFFLIALTLLIVRTRNEWLRWWGIPFLITGILGAAFALTAAPLLALTMETLFRQGGSDIPAVLQELAQNMTGALAREILKPVSIQGLILAAIGLAMAVVNAILNRKHMTRQRI